MKVNLDTVTGYNIKNLSLQDIFKIINMNFGCFLACSPEILLIPLDRCHFIVISVQLNLTKS